MRTNTSSRTVLITGTSSGIGRATVKLFSEKGWNVAATLRSPANETEMQNWPGVTLYALDVTDTASIDGAIKAVITDLGPIDVLVNNAGYGVDGVFEAMSDEVIERQFNTNVFGLMRMTRALIPHMRERKAGTIIQIASMGGRLAFPLFNPAPMLLRLRKLLPDSWWFGVVNSSYKL